MRRASSRMLVLWVRSGTQSVITIACWWWWIMPCMKATSASRVRDAARSSVPGGDLARRLAGRAGLDDVGRGLLGGGVGSGSAWSPPHPASTTAATHTASSDLPRRIFLGYRPR